jgi:DNA repair protein RecO (recombination protein O)
MYSSIEKLYSFTVKDDVIVEIENVMKRYIAKYIDRKFKSVEMLDIF